MDCDLDQAGRPTATPTRTPADSNGPMHVHLILAGECVQLQGETWQRGDQLSSRQMTRGVGGLLIFPAIVLSPAAVGC